MNQYEVVCNRESERSQSFEQQIKQLQSENKELKARIAELEKPRQQLDPTSIKEIEFIKEQINILKEAQKKALETNNIHVVKEISELLFTYSSYEGV